MSDSASHPLVCICVPTYNAQDTVAETITSILAQTHKNLVLNIVDNCSTDSTVEVARSFRDERIKVHINDVNVGGEGNFNRCIDLGAGDYLAIYHADDVYDPEMVEAEVAFLEEHPSAVAVFTDAVTINQNGEVVGSIGHPAELSADVLDFASVLTAVMRHSNFLVTPSVMARTSTYRGVVRRWRPELFGPSADLDVWFRMLRAGSIGILRRQLMRYRISDKQWSARVRAATERADFFRVMDHYIAQPETQAILSARNFEDYSRLERRDCLMRAVNALVDGQSDLAWVLCPNPLSRPVLISALTDRRSAAVLLMSAFVRASMALRLDGFSRLILLRLKKWTHR